MRMTYLTSIAIAVTLLLNTNAYSQGNTWKKVRYNGGTVATKTDPDDWDNTLTVTSDAIKLVLEDGQSVTIDPAKVSSLSYGQEAHRRVGTMIALGILVAPLALFGLFHKTKKHFIGLDYETADGKRAGVLLQGHKDNFRAILLALSSTTGQPVSVDPKDRKEIPANVAVVEATAPSDDKAATAAPQPAATGVIKLDSAPAGAEIYVDGAFVGNAPAQLKLAPGKHTVRVVAAGQQDWVREIEVLAGSEVSLTAKMAEAAGPR